MKTRDGDTTVVSVHDDTRRVSIRSRGWGVRWKHWTNIPKIYVVEVLVDFLST